METLHFSVQIKAPREKVWDVMLDKETYGEWAKAFGEGSQYKGDWEEGSPIQFLGGDGATGMASRIQESRKPEFISIEHVGIVMNGVVDSESDEAKKWAPSLENYTFEEMNGETRLSVSIQVSSEYRSMFEETWPNALQLLKELAEK